MTQRTPNIRRILVPIDYTAGSREALRYATFLASCVGASVDVAHVSDPGPDGAREVLVVSDGQTLPLTRNGQSAEQEMADLFAQIEARGEIKLEVFLVNHDVAQSIVEAARGYDLVVMATHGRSGLSRILQPSVAERVVRLAPCPVMSVQVAA
jgi:nucleotide-binding universal stress UspA family protein